jgi:hypothetical protein
MGDNKTLMRFEGEVTNVQELVTLLADQLQPGDRAWFRGNSSLRNV